MAKRDTMMPDGGRMFKGDDSVLDVAAAIESMEDNIDDLQVAVGAVDDNTVGAGADGTISAKLKRTTATLGQTDDASVAAGAAGSISAKLRRLTTDLDGAATTLQNILTALTDGTQKVQLNGSLMELYGATEAQRPAANSVPIGAVYMAVDTQEIWQSNGTSWVVM